MSGKEAQLAKKRKAIPRQGGSHLLPVERGASPEFGTSQEELSHLAKELIRRKRIIGGNIQSMVEAAAESGQIFLRVKELLPHGEFQAWAQKEVSYDIRTVQRFMKLAPHIEVIRERGFGNITQALQFFEAGMIEAAPRPRPSATMSPRELARLLTEFQKNSKLKISKRDKDALRGYVKSKLDAIASQRVKLESVLDRL